MKGHMNKLLKYLRIYVIRAVAILRKTLPNVSFNLKPVSALTYTMAKRTVFHCSADIEAELMTRIQNNKLCMFRHDTINVENSLTNMQLLFNSLYT